MMTKRMQRLALMACLLGSFGTGGCVSANFNDSIELSNGQLMVVGYKGNGSARIWVLENGEFVEVDVVEAE